MSAPEIGADATAQPATVVGTGAVPAFNGKRQGRYAGIVSRTVAVSTDAVVLAVLSIGTLFVVQAIIAMIQGEPFGDVSIDSDWGVVIVFFQSALYFTVGWAVFGRTLGEALFGLRMVRRNGGDVGWARAFVRFITSPLAFVLCGIGYLWILVDHRRRTWPDLISGVVVVYDWRRADEPPAEVLSSLD